MPARRAGASRRRSADAAMAGSAARSRPSRRRACSAIDSIPLPDLMPLLRLRAREPSPGRCRILASAALALAAAVAQTATIAAESAAPLPTWHLAARIVAVGLPGVAGVRQIGRFHTGGPIPGNPEFLLQTDPGRVLDPQRLMVAVGRQLRRAARHGGRARPGAILSIDPRGAAHAGRATRFRRAPAARPTTARRRGADLQRAKRAVPERALQRQRPHRRAGRRRRAALHLDQQRLRPAVDRQRAARHRRRGQPERRRSRRRAARQRAERRCRRRVRRRRDGAPAGRQGHGQHAARQGPQLPRQRAADAGRHRARARSARPSSAPRPTAAAWRCSRSPPPTARSRRCTCRTASTAWRRPARCAAATTTASSAWRSSGIPTASCTSPTPAATACCCSTCATTGASSWSSARASSRRRNCASRSISPPPCPRSATPASPASPRWRAAPISTSPIAATARCCASTSTARVLARAVIDLPGGGIVGAGRLRALAVSADAQRLWLTLQGEVPGYPGEDGALIEVGAFDPAGAFGGASRTAALAAGSASPQQGEQRVRAGLRARDRPRPALQRALVRGLPPGRGREHARGALRAARRPHGRGDRPGDAHRASEQPGRAAPLDARARPGRRTVGRLAAPGQRRARCACRSRSSRARRSTASTTRRSRRRRSARATASRAASTA